jgi:hypothetical protein
LKWNRVKMTQQDDGHIEHLGVLESGTLFAEYSLRKRSSDGQWVAVGRVTDRSRSGSNDGWIISGYGETSKEAVNRVQALLDSAHARLASRYSSCREQQFEGMCRG